MESNSLLAIREVTTSLIVGDIIHAAKKVNANDLRHSFSVSSWLPNSLS
jgi:hypothetical protein